MKENSYYLVAAEALPPVFKGVVNAKELIASGRVTSTAQAVKNAGISRSAFYKYKDFVFKYSAPGTTVSLNALLSDRAGVFSALTAALYGCGANIITVTQGLPEGGVANASLTVSLAAGTTAEQLKESLLSTDGIISIKIIDGGKND